MMAAVTNATVAADAYRLELKAWTTRQDSDGTVLHEETVSMRPNTRIAPIVRNSIATSTDGSTSGSVIVRKRSNFEAPATSATSYSDRSMLWSPARMISAMNAEVFQTSATMTMMSESTLLACGVVEKTPSWFSGSTRKPMVGWKSRKKIIPWMTIGTAHGRMMATRAQRRPRNSWLRMSAWPKPSTVSKKTLTTVKMTVTVTALVNIWFGSKNGRGRAALRSPVMSST